MKTQPTDHKKIEALNAAMRELIEQYYPGDTLTGHEVLEILDTLAMMTIFIICSLPPQLRTAFKRHFAQRLAQMEAVNKQLEHEHR